MNLTGQNAERREQASAATTAEITHTASLETLLAAPCPDFPVLPGVCVLEYLRASAEASVPAPGLRWHAVDRVRFVGPVFPGEELTVRLTWQRSGEDEWTGLATASTVRGTAASARLRYVGEADR
ncbi:MULTISPECIES: hypothetical protein [Streptomyces]|uniref:ApeI dehydratase-like domain-containing protein n=1 Tax=Streptomyces rhizosphaericus TaxID=114699 RepID=A0A6G4ACA2_9ACTN|nr:MULTISPECIES: hypothetical protein [Streptomyces]MBA6439836.1 hypothetical protein [Streptomyces sp. GMR22]MBI0377664.1 hypothetical protein [Streptomyces albiflaviniger]NEW70464.1 hypothetical protein [Streptomyces rhizosphaericus]